LNPFLKRLSLEARLTAALRSADPARAAIVRKSLPALELAFPLIRVARLLGVRELLPRVSMLASRPPLPST
jgi:hypothetical protein